MVTTIVKYGTSSIYQDKNVVVITMVHHCTFTFSARGYCTDHHGTP